MIKKIHLIVETAIFIIILLVVVKCNRTKIGYLEQNILGYKSNIEQIQTENNELLISKNNLILSEKAAREELEMTKAEYREIERELNDKIAYISYLESTIDMNDTIWMEADTVYIEDNSIYKNFLWRDEWSAIDATVLGNSVESSRLRINSLLINTSVEIGLTEEYKFWIKSDNPNIKFTNVKGSIIQNSTMDDNRRRISHGLSVGFGFHYGLFGKSWDFGPQLGYSIHIKL